MQLQYSTEKPLFPIKYSNLVNRRPPSPTESLESANSHQLAHGRAMSDADKLRKVCFRML